MVRRRACQGGGRRGRAGGGRDSSIVSLAADWKF
jgi:hypothetical protein